jgi:hypothetical protein
MSESSSVSKGPIVVKILIDLSEYLALKKAKQRQDESEDHLSKSYEEKVAAPMEEDTVSEGEGQNLVRAVPAIQVGQGADLKEVIAAAIAEGFKGILHSQLSTSLRPQIGGSSLNDITDLAPPPPQGILNEDDQPPSGLELMIKSDENSSADENNLLGKIPSKFREKAKDLLKAFNENPTSFSWNTDGLIFVNGENLPNSNIFTLLPELFKGNPNKESPGFYEVVKQLANLGLGHLIHKNILRGLKRMTPIENQTVLFDFVKQNPGKWYFLGQ